jgi:HAE1 family hydrophobic/amphiphilic exporter-1
MSKFFIRRPIVAIVIAILTVIIGVISMLTLPTAQFPDIVPPEIMVQATYPGADAKTLTQAVATPIEQQVNGVDHMIYMDSVSANNGQATVYVDFDLKTNPDTDQVLTQIRVTQAQSQLPPEVNTAGLVVQNSLTSPLMVIALSSPDGSHDVNFLTNYAIINVQDELTRLPGVARIQVFGGQYAIRVWVNPDQLAKLGVTATDVINAVQVQNNVNPAGQIGGEPVPNGQQFTFTVRTQGRLVTPEEFGNIVIRANPDGSVLHLRDVARIELGTQTYDLTARYNNAPAGVMAVYSLPGSNAVQTAAAVSNRMRELSADFPRACVTRSRSIPPRPSRRHSRNRHHSLARAVACHPGRVRFPSGLARDADSVTGCARLADRNLHRISVSRLFGQHSVSVWISVSHRACGRRRHHRRGGRRTSY